MRELRLAPLHTIQWKKRKIAIVHCRNFRDIDFMLQNIVIDTVMVTDTTMSFLYRRENVVFIVGLSRYYMFTFNVTPIFQPWQSADTDHSDISMLRMKHTFIICSAVWSVKNGSIK